MNTKRQFGEYHFKLKELAKETGLGPDKFVAIARAMIKDIGKASQEALEHWLLAVAENSLLKGKGSHYFIETDALAAHLEAIASNYDPRMLEIIEDEEISLGIIHTCGKNAKAVMFAWAKASKTLVVSDEKETGYCHGYRPAEAQPATTSTQLLFGLCLYLNCFPDSVRDGFPNFAKHPAHYKGHECAAVGAAPEILERSGPAPYFRNGHYRILSSERFKHKRWQVVFVDETFVKGKAETVTEVQPKARS